MGKTNENGGAVFFLCGKMRENEGKPRGNENFRWRVVGE